MHAITPPAPPPTTAPSCPDLVAGPPSASNAGHVTSTSARAPSRPDRQHYERLVQVAPDRPDPRQPRHDGLAYQYRYSHDLRTAHRSDEGAPPCHLRVAILTKGLDSFRIGSVWSLPASVQKPAPTVMHLPYRTEIPRSRACGWASPEGRCGKRRAPTCPPPIWQLHPKRKING